MKENNGATFSECKNYRFALWRIWDDSLPLVMFIGLNPSKANESEPDNTIKSVTRLSKYNGYGGFYMMNCFPFVSTNPDDLIATTESIEFYCNNIYLSEIAKKCTTIVFAWGNFKIVKMTKRDKWMIRAFPNAKALHINQNGSPKHPLYCKSTTEFIDYKQK